MCQLSPWTQSLLLCSVRDVDSHRAVTTISGETEKVQEQWG